MFLRSLSRRLSHTAPSVGRRCFSTGGWNQRGYDLTADMLSARVDADTIPKVIITGYASSGFDVQNAVKKVNPYEDSDGILHFHGSIMVFPQGCFLWNVEHPKDITIESLLPALLHRPKLDLLYIGCNRKKTDGGVPRNTLNTINEEFIKHGVAVEQLNLGDAIGTFNILNAEDRRVAVALVLDPTDSEEDDDGPW